jgi:hypothetical protein
MPLKADIHFRGDHGHRPDGNGYNTYDNVYRVGRVITSSSETVSLEGTGFAYEWLWREILDAEYGKEHPARNKDQPSHRDSG